MRQKITSLLIGILMGIAMFGGNVAHAAAEYLRTLPSAQAIYLDGIQIELEAYTINGTNYVKLRDIGEAVGFNVYWDGAVQIDSGSSYTGIAPEETEDMTELPEVEDIDVVAKSEKTEQTGSADLSQQVNKAVFTNNLTSEAYNGIRQAMLTGQSETHFTVSTETRRMLNTVLSNIGSVYQYQLNAQLDGSYICTASERKAYAAAVTAVSGLLKEINALPDDAAKVRYINEVICDKLTYQSGVINMPGKLFTTDGLLAGNCASYFQNFKFLCDLAGIPCFGVYSLDGSGHGWNMVYVNGVWSHVDCVSNDVGDDPNYREAVLMKASPSGVHHVDAYPEITAFCKELLVPGSTK